MRILISVKFFLHPSFIVNCRRIERKKEKIIKYLCLMRPSLARKRHNFMRMYYEKKDNVEDIFALLLSSKCAYTQRHAHKTKLLYNVVWLSAYIRVAFL